MGFRQLLVADGHSDFRFDKVEGGRFPTIKDKKRHREGKC